MQFLTYGSNVTIVISNTDIAKYPYILNIGWKYFQFLLHFNSCYLKLLHVTLAENASHFCNNIHYRQITIACTSCSHNWLVGFAGRPKTALLLWFFGDFRCGALLFVVIHVIYKYKNR